METNDNLTLFSGIATLLFIVISFIEFRLNAYLRRHYNDIKDEELRQQYHKVMARENQWNLFSWILIIGLFILPDNYTMLLTCILCLFETLVTHQMDQLKAAIQNQ